MTHYTEAPEISFTNALSTPDISRVFLFRPEPSRGH